MFFKAFPFSTTWSVTCRWNFFWNVFLTLKIVISNMNAGFYVKLNGSTQSRSVFFSAILHHVSLFLHHVELLRLLQTAACSQFLLASSLGFGACCVLCRWEEKTSQLHLQQSDEILIKKLNLIVRWKLNIWSNNRSTHWQFIHAHTCA